jgi:recombination protein RecR
MLPKSIQNLIDELSKLPGVGPKTAARLTFYLLSKPQYDIDNIGKAFLELNNNIKKCKNCFNITDKEVCFVCENEKRNQSLVAVVEEPLDVIALEKSYGYDGVYHVLGGSISPIEGIGPENLRIQELIDRIIKGEIEEIILATNPDLEGEATAAYIKEKITNTGKTIRVTRIARGLPVGGELEYADEVTLKRSMEGRRDY